MYLDLEGRQQRLSMNTKDVRKWKRMHQCGKSLEIFLIRLSFLVVDMEQGSKQQLIVIFSAFADRSPGRITLQPQPRGILINNISRHYDNAYNMNERDSLIKKDGVLYLG
jgi:hypothetical protein